MQEAPCPPPSAALPCEKTLRLVFLCPARRWCEGNEHLWQRVASMAPPGAQPLPVAGKTFGCWGAGGKKEAGWARRACFPAFLLCWFATKGRRPWSHTRQMQRFSRRARSASPSRVVGRGSSSSETTECPDNKDGADGQRTANKDESPPLMPL